MGLEARPYVGTWKLNNRKVVKHTPDALVYVNGDLALPGCPTCSGKIDLQKYITQVSIDPSTEGPATASITIHAPRSAGDGLVRDGNFIVRPGLEVHIYLRGYFPVKGLTSGITPAQTGGVDVQNAVMYPYYLVHHGVITDVNYEYSGGEHTASISCADMLHFWQYQRMSTQGSLFGARPMNSKVKMSLVGHNLTGMSPFAIIYQLFRDVQGSAGGVEFALGNKTNAAANSTVIGESLFSLSILYWQKRFSQTMMSLRMYGADGTLYNAFQAAFLASLGQEDPARIAKKYGASHAQSSEVNPVLDRAARITGWDPYSLNLGASGASDNSDGKLGINLAQLQAFTSDISQWGSVNFFESQYATKLEIANNVKEACGYEFYQDVDGNLVFKPPFYNLDTSTSRVYRLEDIDIISFSAASKEPDATVVKVTGGHFRNMTGTGLENNEWGTRAEFIDYRLVAQFGWRQQTFETTYHTDSQAMFFACVARFDIFNIGMNSATATIPLRPELRPGYPVYIAPLDCYYYVHSFNHSFSFGGQCTTTLNLVGRRAKFFAPGKPPQDGSRAQISNIHLGAMHEPALPLEITEIDGEPVMPRLQGFPNVVMTLDPTAINPLSFMVGTDINDLQTEDAIRNLIQQALNGRLSVLQQGDGASTPSDESSRQFDGPWQLQTGDAASPIVIPSVSELLSQARQLKSFYDNKKANQTDRARVDAATAPLQALVEAARDAHAKLFPEEDSSATYLALLGDLKATYNPGANLPGYYRYFSSSHPDAEMQGPVTWSVNSSGIVSTGSTTRPDASRDQVATQFQTTTKGGTTLVTNGQVHAGIPILKPGTTDQTVSTPTHQITTFQIARYPVEAAGTKAGDAGELPTGFPASALAAEYQKYFLARMGDVPVGPSSVVGAVFLPTYDLIAKLIEEKVGVYPPFPNASATFGSLRGIDNPSRLSILAQDMADACATTVSNTLLAKYKAVLPVTGVVTSAFGTRPPPKTETGHGSTEHEGEDIGAPVGTPIYAALAGTVNFAGPRGGYGNLLIIKHSEGTFTRYAHCDTIIVSVGQAVTVGQQVATVGRSGNVTGPHLHFEVRVDGRAVDPASYLDSLGASTTVADVDAIWASVWPPGSQVKSGAGRKRTAKATNHVKYYDVPVLPVSDARGYEVVGTYRYGRGLTIESLDAMSGFTSNSTEDYESVEAFIDAVKKDASDASLSVAIGNLSPALRAQLASGTMSDAVTNMIKLDDPGGSQTALKGMNFPADKREFTQKATVTNAAYSLADLSVTANRRTVCSCKGAEADTLLRAFDSSLFVGVEDLDTGDTEQVQDWLTDQMVATSTDWAATQSAYRGTVRDAGSAGLFDVVKDAVTNYANIVPSTGAALAGASSGNVDAAQARLDADIAAFRGGG
jgi:murein DD-endopeptidase MepM/ murein hydrolase activator NlpD